MLDTLPPELIAQISYHLVADTGAPPAALLATSRAVHAAATPTPELYARVFREYYDTSAAVRRFGPLSNRDFGAELRTRTAAFARLNAGQVSARDLWVVYIMLIENGKDTYPPERVEDALAMWISWLLDDHTKSTKALFRSMRPYVFAAQCYELFFAPWTRLRLPSDRQLPYVPGLFMADPNPYSRANVVPLYGRDVALAHPPLTHAAMLRFFAGTQDADEPSSAASSATPTEVAFDISTTDLRSFPRPVLVSDAHDADFARLQSCTDGTRSAGRPISAWRGVFAGCWEGTFTFLDFDAFRDMLRGETRPVYEGLFGEQAQVWKLRETFVRLKVGQAGGSGSSAAAGGTSSSSSSSNRTTAVARNYLPLAGPMTNAGFPTTLRDFDLASIARRAPGTSPEDATIDDAVGRQLEALDGYEAVPEDEVDVALAAAAPDLALLVTGVGHSAWGRFIISGHVRVWDGLVYLVKEYAPDNRGKWVYRGYVTNDDIMLGRWRDTFTHDDYVGYEGTFVLSRRS